MLLRGFFAKFAKHANSDPDQDWDSDCESEDKSKFALIKSALLICPEFGQRTAGLAGLGVVADIAVLSARLTVYNRG